MTEVMSNCARSKLFISIYVAALYNLTDVTLAVKKQGSAQMSPSQWGHVRGSGQGVVTSRPAAWKRTIEGSCHQVCQFPAVVME